MYDVYCICTDTDQARLVSPSDPAMELVERDGARLQYLHGCQGQPWTVAGGLGLGQVPSFLET